MKISFVGTGYVGLVSGVMMSYIGHDVVCIDVDESKINALKMQKLMEVFSETHSYVDTIDCEQHQRFVN